MNEKQKDQLWLETQRFANSLNVARDALGASESRPKAVRIGPFPPAVCRPLRSLNAYMGFDLAKPGSDRTVIAEWNGKRFVGCRDLDATPTPPDSRL